MKLKVCHSGKAEARLQLLQAINETAVCIRNKLECMQWQHSLAQQVAACVQYNGAY
jgi:hypothetical protein